MDWGNLVGFTDLGDSLSDVLVESSNLKGSGGSKEGVVGSLDGIGLLSLGFSSDNDGMGGVGTESIEMGSELNLDEILVGKFDGIFWSW